MDPSDKRQTESLVALLKREDWYHPTSGAESSSSHVLDSTLAHCRISPVTVSQTPNSSTASTSATATTTTSSIISFLQYTGNKASVYNQSSRKVINTWLFHVVDEMNLPRELAPLSLFYIDRYVNSFLEFKYDLNIVAASALSLAIKSHIGDADAHVFTKYLVMVSNHEYSFLDTDMYQMELDILEKLNWRVNPPSSQRFLYEFEQVWNTIPTFASISAKTKEIVFQVANYVLELIQSALLSGVTEHPPSIIALATLVFAMKDVHQSAISSLLKTMTLSKMLELCCVFSSRSYKDNSISNIAHEIEEYVGSLFALSYVYKEIDPRGIVYNYYHDERKKRSLSASHIEAFSIDMGRKSFKRSLSVSPSRASATATECHLFH